MRGTKNAHSSHRVRLVAYRPKDGKTHIFDGR